MLCLKLKRNLIYFKIFRGIIIYEPVNAFNRMLKAANNDIKVVIVIDV